MDIKSRNNLGDLFGTEKVEFEFLEPEFSISKSIIADDIEFLVSSCVFPGIDPRKECNKECQDSCKFFSDKTSLLAVLFDGHG